MPAECLRVATVVQSYSVQAVIHRLHFSLGSGQIIDSAGAGTLISGAVNAHTHPYMALIGVLYCMPLWWIWLGGILLMFAFINILQLPVTCTCTLQLRSTHLLIVSLVHTCMVFHAKGLGNC